MCHVGSLSLARSMISPGFSRLNRDYRTVNCPLVTLRPIDPPVPRLVWWDVLPCGLASRHALVSLMGGAHDTHRDDVRGVDGDRVRPRLQLRQTPARGSKQRRGDRTGRRGRQKENTGQTQAGQGEKLAEGLDLSTKTADGRKPDDPKGSSTTLLREGASGPAPKPRRSNPGWPWRSREPGSAAAAIPAAFRPAHQCSSACRPHKVEPRSFQVSPPAEPPLRGRRPAIPSRDGAVRPRGG